MTTDHRAALARIKRFDQLTAYLRDEMNWPLRDATWDELTFDFTADELGIDPKTAAKIQEIKRLRPISPKQPWGIFFVKFEPRKLPVVALRRILSQVALKKRASANSAERGAWAADDLLFVSNYGEGDERQISFAHFSKAADGHDLPTLKVLGWDNLDTALHLDAVAKELTEHLGWPDDESDVAAWRQRWRAAFSLRHREVVSTAKELSVRLAELARAIRDRIKAALAIESERGPLTKFMKAFQESLVHDLDVGGFADMYAQTIAYGLLSARIANPHKKTADDFAAHMRTNPFLKELMETFLQVGGRRGRAGGPGVDFDELGVSEVVELLDEAKMESVVRDFGDRNPQEDPVIHFYEHFLAAYDKGQKVSRGVFYTPLPVVSYIVRSVDELLRADFGLTDGLADTATWGEMSARYKGLEIPEGVAPAQDFVQILDPATGTGTFLVEAIDLIHKTMLDKWRAQGHGDEEIEELWNQYVPKHLLPRLHGYELLMAPYAIAHLKVGLKLYETGYRFGSTERARVYLTNALEPPVEKQLAFGFLPALAHEARAVNDVKRARRFTVVIGNPPYSNFGRLNRIPHILKLLEDYKSGLNEKKINLDDDFIKFVRFAHSTLNHCGYGILGFITNNVFLDGLTHRRMREALLETFPHIEVLDLHGNASAHEKAPDGSNDENVFDITQGVSISAMCRPVPRPGTARRVLFSEMRGSREGKYQRLLAPHEPGAALHVSGPNFFFTPKDLGLSSEYMTFMPLHEIFIQPSYGIQTKRDALTIAFESDEALERARHVLKNSDGKVREAFGLPPDGRDWAVGWARSDLARLKDLKSYVRRVLYRPFDERWTIYTDRSKGFLAYPRWQSMKCMLEGNLGLIAMRQVFQDVDVYSHFGVTDAPIDERTFYSNRGGTYLFPLYGDAARSDRFLAPGLARRHNLNPALFARLSASMGLPARPVGGRTGAFEPEEFFHYAYAAFSSPTLRARYASLLRIDFPRLPLPGSLDLFRGLARLGAELVDLQLLKSAKLDQFITAYTGPKMPEVGRVGWSNDTVWLDAAAAKKGHRATPGSVGFHGVPEAVWDFHVGGYQVCEKWLKDRQGRRLKEGDLTHFQRMIVALNETIRLMREIDVVIEKHGGWPAAFKAATENAATTRRMPFPPRVAQPLPADRYVTCLPLVPLKIAAGAFSDPQQVDGDGWDWVEIKSEHPLRRGMFVAQVVGRSMEPAIPDGSFCLFAAPVTGSRQGKTVLAQLRDATDPENGERYTVKRYESEKAKSGDSWRHARITLRPVNPEFDPIVLSGTEEGQVQVIAEVVEVLRDST